MEQEIYLNLSSTIDGNLNQITQSQMWINTTIFLVCGRAFEDCTERNRAKLVGVRIPGQMTRTIKQEQHK